jgi:hypothetical protein
MGSETAALGGLIVMNLMVWDRVFDPVGRPEGPQFHFQPKGTAALRNASPGRRPGSTRAGMVL